MNGTPKTRQITTNLPTNLLQEACDVSGAGITETLIHGLSLIQRSKAAAKAAGLKGRFKLNVDLEISRERTRR